MAGLRSEYQAAVATSVLIPLIYLVLIVPGVGSGTAMMWAPVPAAVFAAIALAAYARTSPDHTSPHHVDWRKLLLRAAVLLVLVMLIESILSGLLGGYVPVAATDGPDSHPVQLLNTLGTMLILPINLLVIFGLGVWSARLLVSPHPMMWLAAVAVSDRVIRLLLYWPTVAYSRSRNIAVYGFGHTLLRYAVLSVLTFCLLALGNRYGHRPTMNKIDVQDSPPKAGCGRLSITCELPPGEAHRMMWAGAVATLSIDYAAAVDVPWGHTEFDLPAGTHHLRIDVRPGELPFDYRSIEYTLEVITPQTHALKYQAPAIPGFQPRLTRR